MSLIKPAKNKINSTRDFRKYVYHRFPENLGAHAIVLNFKNYSFDATQGGISSIDPRSSIVLPIPSNLSDTYTVNANQGSLGIAGSIAGSFLNSAGNVNGEQAADDVLNKGKEVINSAMSGNMPEFGTEFAAYGKFLRRSAVDGLFPGAGMAIDMATGTSINPHLSVNFDGVALKTHNFTWQFSPRNESESRKLLDIQNTIRRSILPRYKSLGSGSGIAPLDRALLTYPHLVDIFFVGVDQSYYYYFKPAMVQQFELNFGGGGPSPAILKGGKPAIVNMTMQLVEAQIHTSGDYYDSDGSNPVTEFEG